MFGHRKVLLAPFVPRTHGAPATPVPAKAAD